MEIKRKYKLNVVLAYQSMSGYVGFEFNSIVELKQFMNKHYSGSSALGTYLSLKAYEEVYTWNMSAGTVSITTTLIDLDS